MKRLAIFVEGQTEQIFVGKMVTEIAGEKNISIDYEKAHKNKKGNRVFVGITEIAAHSEVSGQKYYVLIRDCGSENNVKSDIVDSYAGLASKNYEKILGLRDVFPNFTYADIRKLEAGLKYQVPTRPMPVNILLAVMEVEAWFLAETTHFYRIHSSLTIDLIKAHFFDPNSIDVERRINPAKDLDAIYHLAGRAYTKKKKNALRTVKALDYSLLYCDLQNRVNRLGQFIGHINSFLEPKTLRAN